MSYGILIRSTFIYIAVSDKYLFYLLRQKPSSYSMLTSYIYFV